MAEALQRHPELRNLMQTMQAASALQEVVDLCALSWVTPGTLQARSLVEGELVLMAASAGVVAKLRQSERRLLQLLQAKGLVVHCIKLRVQAGAQRVVQPPAPRVKTEPSAQAKAALAQLRAIVKRS